MCKNKHGRTKKTGSDGEATLGTRAGVHTLLYYTVP